MTTDLTLEKFSQLRGLYGAFQTTAKKRRQFYALDFEKDVIPGGKKSGIRAVIPTTARRAIDEAVDHVLTMPKVHVPVRPTNSEFVTQQEISEKKRKAITAWWRQIQQRFNPIGDGRKWLFLDGMLCIRHTLRWDLIPSKDDPDYRGKLANLGRAEFLWEERVLNNEWVYADPADHRNPQYVYVNYSMSVEAARKKFPGESGEWRTRPDYSKVQYLEGWSAPTFTDGGEWEPGQFRQWIDTELVTNEKNPYPYIPIAIEDSGYGSVHEGAEIEDKFVGLLDHSFSVLIAQARQWTTSEHVAELTGFNPIITRNMPEAKRKNLRSSPGVIWDLDGASDDPNREEIELVKWPDMPIVVQQVIALTDREVNSSLKSDTLGGMPQRGVDTATEADQNVRNSAAKLSNPVAALERMVAKLTRWFLMDIEMGLEAPVTLFGSGPDDPADVTLTPLDISHYYDVFVQLGTTDEEALNMTRARFWGELYRLLPTLSAWTTMEAGGMANDPLAEMIRRAGEDVFLSPEFRQIRTATGAESFGELAKMLAMMAGDAPGAGATPGAASDLSLVKQDTMASPVESRVVTEALINRDTDQGGAALRAPSG